MHGRVKNGIQVMRHANNKNALSVIVYNERGSLELKVLREMLPIISGLYGVEAVEIKRDWSGLEVPVLLVTCTAVNFCFETDPAHKIGEIIATHLRWAGELSYGTSVGEYNDPN